jgi:hypothetical protein
MTGPLTMNQSSTGSNAATLLSATRAQSVAGDSPLICSSLSLAFTGGAGLSTTNILVNTDVASSLDSNGNAIDGPAVQTCTLVSCLNSSALRPLGTSPGAAQQVSIQSAPTRDLPPGGVPAGRQMAELCSLWLPTIDKTNLPSSISNSLIGCGADLCANNIDDMNGRCGLVGYVPIRALPRNSNGWRICKAIIRSR